MSRVVQKVGPKEWAGLKVGDEVSMQDLVAAREAATGGVMKLSVTRGGNRVVLDVPVKTETVPRPHYLNVANDGLWTEFSARP